MPQPEEIVAAFPWYPWATEEFYALHLGMEAQITALPDDAPEAMKEFARTRPRTDPELLRAAKIAKVPVEGGKYELSVLCSPMAYSNGFDTYEVLVERLDGEPVTAPRGHVDAAGVVAMLEEWRHR